MQEREELIESQRQTEDSQDSVDANTMRNFRMNSF